MSITTLTLVERNGLLLSDKQMKRLCLTGKENLKVAFVSFIHQGRAVSLKITRLRPGGFAITLPLLIEELIAV